MSFDEIAGLAGQRYPFVNVFYVFLLLSFKKMSYESFILRFHFLNKLDLCAESLLGGFQFGSQTGNHLVFLNDSLFEVAEL